MTDGSMGRSVSSAEAVLALFLPVTKVFQSQVTSTLLSDDRNERGGQTPPEVGL